MHNYCVKSPSPKCKLLWFSFACKPNSPFVVFDSSTTTSSERRLYWVLVVPFVYLFIIALGVSESLELSVIYLKDIKATYLFLGGPWVFVKPIVWSAEIRNCYYEISSMDWYLHGSCIQFSIIIYWWVVYKNCYYTFFEPLLEIRFCFQSKNNWSMPPSPS